MGSDYYVSQVRALGSSGRRIDVYVHHFHPDVRDLGLPMDAPSVLRMLWDATYDDSEDGPLSFRPGPLQAAVGERWGDPEWLVTHAASFISNVTAVETDPTASRPDHVVAGGLDPTSPHGTLRIEVTHVAWLLHLEVGQTWSSRALGIADDASSPIASDPRPELTEVWYSDSGTTALPAFCDLLNRTVGRKDAELELHYFVDDHGALCGELKVYDSDGQDSWIDTVVTQEWSPLAEQCLALVPGARVEAFVQAWGRARESFARDEGHPAWPFQGLALDALLDTRIVAPDLSAHLRTLMDDD